MRKSSSLFGSTKCRYRSMVRTPASQAGNAGSIPVICSRLIYGYSSMVEQRSPKPLMWVQLLLPVPWSHSSVGRAKDWNFLWRWFNSSWDHHFLTINCLCGDFRHATVFLIFKDKTIQPARLSFQAKVQYRKHEPVHHKKQGTEVHCIPPEVPKLELYSSNVTL